MTGFRKRLPLLIFMVLLILAVVFASFYGGVLPFLCLFFLLSCPAFSLLYALYSHFTFRIYHELADRRIKKGEEVTYRLVLENHGPFPLFLVTLQYEEQLCDLREMTTTLSLLPWQRLTLTTPLSCRYAGTYPVGVLFYAIRDPFGLFSFRFSVPSEYRAIVRPRITNDAGHRVLSTLRTPDRSVQPDLYEDVLGNNLKTYQPGDPVHAIHWRNYARTGEVLIRTPEEENMGKIHILLDSEEVVQGIDSMRRRDLFLEYVISVAHAFLKQGKPVDFSYAAGDLKTSVIAGWRDFSDFWNQMPEDLVHHRSEDFEIQREKRIRELSVAGEEWISISERDFRREGEL